MYLPTPNALLGLTGFYLAAGLGGSAFEPAAPHGMEDGDGRDGAAHASATPQSCVKVILALRLIHCCVSVCAIAPRRAVCRGFRSDTMQEIEMWSHAADSAVASIHASTAKRALARGLADWLQAIASNLSPTEQWGLWTWSALSASDALILSVDITNYLFPHDLRNELAGQHLLALRSMEPIGNRVDLEDRTLWVGSYYQAQRITPISISGPKSPEQKLYIGKLLERISYQMMPRVEARRPPVAVRPGEDFSKPHARKCNRYSLHSNCG